MLELDGSESWNLIVTENHGHPMITRINAALKNQHLETQYPYRVGIAIPLKYVQANGLPTEEENKSLLKVEDYLLRVLDMASSGILSAVISTNGMRELMMYCNTENATDIAAQMQKSFPNYEFQHYSQLDPDWSGYLALLQMSSGNEHSNS